jgi:hypothetical protein
MALVKVTIAPEGGGPIGPMEAYFNPKEISIDKSVPWQQQPNSKGDEPPVEFTTGSPRTMGFELLIDGWEKKLDVYNAFIRQLEKIVLIDEAKKRPPMVTVVAAGQTFKGVCESMNVKYTMFLETGSPCRATVNLKFKAAEKAEAKESSSASNNQAPASGTTAQEGARADQTTAAATGNPNPSSADTRATMDANGVDNPNSVPAGSTVSAPGGR